MEQQPLSNAQQSDDQDLLGRDAVYQKMMTMYHRLEPLPREDLFERVHAATVLPMTKEHLPKIRKKYLLDWLETEKIRLLLQGESGIQQFEDDVRKGKFVFHPDEKQGDELSVFEDMERRLSTRPGPDEPVYAGRILEAKDGTKDILGWITWLQTHKNISDDHRRKIFHLLSTGVTGKMTYIGDPPLEELQEQVENLVIFDTVQGPIAANRLMAAGSDEMYEFNRSTKWFLLYRLFGLTIDPRPESLYREVRLGENAKSDKFFSDRMCKQNAIDHNPDGPASIRDFMAQKIRLIPSWVWMAGAFTLFRKRSKSLWERQKEEMGKYDNPDR